MDTRGQTKIRVRKKTIYLSFLFLIVLGVALHFALPDRLYLRSSNKNTPTTSQIISEERNDVLAAAYRAPQIYIYGGENQSSSGGVIPIASTDEPAIYLGGYNAKGTAEVEVYSTNDDAVLDYLTHDKDNKQLKKTPDSNKISKITSFKQEVNTDKNGTLKINLPLGEKGIWYIKITLDSVVTDAFVVRSSIGAVVKEGDNEYIFWGQDYKTKRSLPEGLAIIYNLQDSRKELARVPFGEDGLAKTTFTANADIALIAHEDDRAIIPINLKYVNTSYNYEQFQPKARETKYFIFTDRPLYKPGDTVYFKAVVRDDDDARYSIPGGSINVKIYKDYNEENAVVDQQYPVSADGTVSGEYTLPKEDNAVGMYTLRFRTPEQTKDTYYYWSGDYSSNFAYFDVQYYRKPEFTLDIEAAQREIIAGDTGTFTILGNYFSGQPLVGQKVNYTIRSSDFYEYTYLSDKQYMSQLINDDYRYGFWYGDTTVGQGSVTIDKTGRAVVDFPTKLLSGKGKSQIFSIEATIADGSQNPAFARKNILVYAGEFGIYRKDYAYGTKVNTAMTLPVVLLPYRSGNVADIKLTAKLHRTWWVPYKDDNYKYTQYKKQEEDLSPLEATTDDKGNASFTFTPAKEGSYDITVEGKDARGNLVSKLFYVYVSKEDYSNYSGQGSGDLTVNLDKQKYKPSDTVSLDINSSIPNRDVFLTLERGYVKKYQVVKMQGKQKTVDIPLTNEDIPNIYASVISFSNDAIDHSDIDIPVSAESKLVNVKITPDSKRYGPGETVKLNIDTTDSGGNPVSADVAVWAVDKAIFELSDSTLGDIFDTFWHERYNSTQMAHSLEGIVVLQEGGRGGCFVAGTKVLMADGSEKHIEDIKEGEYILTKSHPKDEKLVKGKVLKTYSTEESGYVVLNSSLKLTADHILWVNGVWKEAGSVQPGDLLLDNTGKSVHVRSVEWLRAKVRVYNLDIDQYHTFFANSVWVHNQKGSPRSTFEDTAYWNPSVHTDSSGRAQVSFTLPDNLTTWTLASVATTSDTKVGQTTTEIIATKDVIVRPLLPNMLRIDDSATVTALVQNFTDKDQVYDVSLKFDSGKVDTETKKGISVSSNATQEVTWKIKAEKENEKSKFTFSAVPQDKKQESDTIIQTIPVREFGFSEKRAETGIGTKTFSLTLAKDIKEDKSSVTVALAPTILGTLPTAMNYLISYPYGCVEQTTSRFVPAVIAKRFPALYPEVQKEHDLDAVIKKGLDRLDALQQSDGGWSWWFSGESDVFITTYVVEYLIEAQIAGIKVNPDMLRDAQSFLERSEYYSANGGNSRSYTKDEYAARNYALQLLNSSSKAFTSIQYDSPDILALVVITNYKNGTKDPEKNGLNRLIGMAKKQGDALYWEAGNKINFGSRDASTAWAVRAILLAGGDQTIAAKGIKYVTRNRQYDYWSNTYATSQVIRALTDYALQVKETTPNYTYTITLDGKKIDSGTVTDSKQIIKPISIPISSLKSGGSKIVVSQKGSGQLYSTLIIDEFHTDRKAKEISNGLKVKREYINEKGSNYTLGVGDTAIVQVTLSGLDAGENYGVIRDELPAGLIPINESFKNEQYGQRSYSSYYYASNVTDREITENGMVLSLYYVDSGEHTYTYRARVVSEGTYIVPPATASLMYAPEISGRSSAETLVVTKEAKRKAVSFDELLKGDGIRNNEGMILAALVIILGIVLLSIERTRIRIKDRIKKMTEWQKHTSSEEKQE